MSFSRVIVRSFSSNSALQQMVKPPIQVFGMEGRYAIALYSAASKQKSLVNVEKDLVKFQNTINKDMKLNEFVRNPSIKRKDKVEALKTISSKMSLSKETTNLLALLAENGRLGKVNNIINAFKLIMAASRGEVVCEVITAKPLDADMKSKLEGALNGFLNKGQTIMLTAKVDPTIIGGMIVSVGDKYVDMSVASKIKKYSDIINTAA
ncbi:PREDICTED: ATP synthase subunit O, mitochondrial [Dufourea novaeangliae]|uniref:ATP synthase subunit O, mitochondrial n=1 Tax=Dufourea novaeangliae TaxID=178035 RepID=UPI0007677D82|nr:PREDICTED: ATP synthase subunit O, mitochondrial [Dufourea novaeangliae]